MAHMELNIDFNLEKSGALIWDFGYSYKCEICAKSEHCFDFQRLSGVVLRPRSGQCSGLPVSKVYIFELQD